MTTDSVAGDTNRISTALDERSLHVRRLVLRSLVSADKGHVGAALSLIEILRTLYERIARHDPARPTWDLRDRVILSKGHGCLGLYAVLVDQGYIPASTLDTFCERHSPLGGHPERQVELGIEASTGALGHGLPLGVGIALAHRRRGTGVRVFVVVGDGELNEGSNWEALLTATKYQLANLTVVVDNNCQQQGGPTSVVLPIDPLLPKFEAFGAYALEADGHCMQELTDTLTRMTARTSGPPGVLVCHTIKGKGFSVAEHNPHWHYQRGFPKETVELLTRELSGDVAHS
jgi:transketolase